VLLTIYRLRPDFEYNMRVVQALRIATIYSFFHAFNLNNPLREHLTFELLSHSHRDFLNQHPYFIILSYLPACSPFHYAFRVNNDSI
jgi:hypothetical protein